MPLCAHERMRIGARANAQNVSVTCTVNFIAKTFTLFHARRSRIASYAPLAIYVRARALLAAFGRRAINISMKNCIVPASRRRRGHRKSIARTTTVRALVSFSFFSAPLFLSIFFFSFSLFFFFFFFM